MKNKLPPPTFETLHIDIVSLSGDGDSLPTEFRMFTAGEVDTLKGKFLFDDIAARDVMAAYADYGNDLCLDYDHAMADPFSAPRDRIAAGWFGLEVRNGELWAVGVRWTPAATRQLNDREWRYMSPAFTVTGENRRIERVINCALTNIPATKNLTPIAASQTQGDGQVTDQPRREAQEMSRMKILLASLGLAENATEAEAIAALNKREDVTAKLVALTGKSTVAEAIALCEGWKANASRAVELEAQLSAERKTREDASANAEIEKAFSDRRITPAQRETASKMYTEHGAAALSAFLSAFVGAQVDTHKPSPAPAADVTALTDADKRIAYSLGITEAQALENKKLSIGGAA